MATFRPATSLAVMLALAGCMSGKPPAPASATSSEKKGQLGVHYYVNLFNPPVGGIITSDFGGINCGASAVAVDRAQNKYAYTYYTAGTVAGVTGAPTACGDAYGQTQIPWSQAIVTLTAHPGPGNAFITWAGDCSGVDTCSLIPGADKSVVAVFGTPGSGHTNWASDSLLHKAAFFAGSVGLDCYTCHGYQGVGQSIAPACTACHNGLKAPVPPTPPGATQAYYSQPVCGTGSCSVGPTGGIASLAGGPAMIIPAGALPNTTTITIAASSIAAPEGAVTGMYEFGPAGTTFAVPVTIQFPVPPGTTAGNATIYWTVAGSSDVWEGVATTVLGTVATGTVTHFSRGFVGAACSPGTACTPANACHRGVTTCNGRPACSDTGQNVNDGAACGGGNICVAGSCRPPPTTCTPGDACTPPSTVDSCQTYAVTCGTNNLPICSGTSVPDFTSCGSGSTCESGTCTALSCGGPTFIGSPPTVVEKQGSGSPPTPTGGSIADGLYEATDWEYYGPTSTSSYAQKFQIIMAGGVMRSAEQVTYNGSVGGAGASVMVPSISGTTITNTGMMCGNAEVGRAWYYSATPTSLTLIGPVQNPPPPGMTNTVYTHVLRRIAP